MRESGAFWGHPQGMGSEGRGSRGGSWGLGRGPDLCPPPADIKEHVKQLEKAVSGKEPRYVLRALRALPSTSRRLNPNVLHKAIHGFFTSNSAVRDFLLGFLEEVRGRGPRSQRDGARYGPVGTLGGGFGAGGGQQQGAGGGTGAGAQPVPSLRSPWTRKQSCSFARGRGKQPQPLSCQKWRPTCSFCSLFS